MRKLILFISILFVSAIMYGQTDVVRNYTKPYFVKNVKVNDTLGTKRLIVTYGAGLNKILTSDAVGMSTWVTATSIVPADTFYFDYCNGCAGVVGWKHIGDTIYADTSVLTTTFRLDSLTSSVYDSLSAHRVILNYYINDSANLVHWSDTTVIGTKYDLDTMKYFPQLFTDSLGGYLNCIDIAYIHQIIGCSPVDFPTGITVSNIGTSSNYVDNAYISKAYITDMSVSTVDMELVTTPDTIVCWEGDSLKYSLVSDITGITMYNQIGDYIARSDSGYFDYINVNTMVANNTLDINSLEIHPTIGTPTDRSPAGYFDSLYVYDTASLKDVTIENSLVFTNGAGEGKVLTSDANGVGTWNAFDFTKLCLPADTGETLLFLNGCLYVADSNEKAIDGITDTTFTWNDANIRCQNKGVGWYLPNKMELDFIYQVWNQPADGGTYRGGVSPLTGFSSTNYWSSTVYSDTDAWSQTFYDGNQRHYNKTTTYNVRCVRR